MERDWKIEYKASLLTDLCPYPLLFLVVFQQELFAFQEIQAIILNKGEEEIPDV